MIAFGISLLVILSVANAQPLEKVEQCKIDGANQLIKTFGLPEDSLMALRYGACNNIFCDTFELKKPASLVNNELPVKSQIKVCKMGGVAMIQRFDDKSIVGPNGLECKGKMEIDPIGKEITCMLNKAFEIQGITLPKDTYVSALSKNDKIFYFKLAKDVSIGGRKLKKNVAYSLNNGKPEVSTLQNEDTSESTDDVP